MAKDFTDAELNEHVSDAICETTNLLNELKDSVDQKLKKRASLLAYWLKTYIHFVRAEDSFLPQSVPRLKRGQIVHVDFGYRVGKEFGGLHYAVVIDNRNDLKSNIVTVVPLMSLKENYKGNRFTAVLPDGIYPHLHKKAEGLLEEANILLQEFPKIENDSAKNKAKLLAAKLLQNRATKMIKEIGHLKQGSVASISQITAISKMRIKSPHNKEDALYELRLSARDMEIINNKIKELYLF